MPVNICLCFQEFTAWTMVIYMYVSVYLHRHTPEHSRPTNNWPLLIPLSPWDPVEKICSKWHDIMLQKLFLYIQMSIFSLWWILYHNFIIVDYYHYINKNYLSLSTFVIVLDHVRAGNLHLPSCHLAVPSDGPNRVGTMQVWAEVYTLVVFPSHLEIIHSRVPFVLVATAPMLDVALVATAPMLDLVLTQGPHKAYIDLRSCLD